MVKAIREIQEFGVEPDIWKIEALDKREHAEVVSAQVRSSDARTRVGRSFSGRGSNKEKVHEWLQVSAPVDGFISFAVGRTNFTEPLQAYLNKSINEDAAINAIAENYKGCVDIWTATKADDW